MNISIQIWYLLLALLLLQFSLSAQYTVTPCSEMGLRPIGYETTADLPIDLLAPYLDEASVGAGITDCWVFQNSNKKDHVIIPGDWDPKPRGALKDLIDDIMQAMTDSRQKYREYGSLDSNLYYLVDDNPIRIDSATAVTYWLIGSKCWMNSQLSALNVGSREAARFVFAHEIGHCFNMENVGMLKNRYDGMNSWFDESIAEFLASEVYSKVNSEFANSRVFDLDGMAFTQPYAAWPLWYYFVLQNGKNALVPEMNNMVEFPNRRSRLSHFRGIQFDEIYHNFLVDFYTRDLEDRAGGQIDMEANISQRQDEIILIPDDVDPINLVEIPSERMSLFVLKIPPSHNLTIYPPAERAERVQYSILNHPDKIKNWNAVAEIEGYCDREREIRILASHLNEDSINDIDIRYELNESLYCCTLTSEISENPSPDDLNGQFHFDYYIESEVEMNSDGTIQTMPMNYYVNSRDGSMLLVRSFFTDNFGTYEDGGMKADAVIWLANGQIVAYVQDKTFGQKRAITLDMNQTRADVMGPRAINPEELLREGQSSGVSPSALPSDNPWAGAATGYAYYREERFDPGTRNLMTAYVSNDNSVVASPMSSFGFMVGHIKDLSGQNKHLVYTRYETPRGDVMKAKLYKLEKECASFDGTGYKKMTLGGSTGAIGAMTESERQTLVANQQAYNVQLGQLIQEMADCGDNENCIARVKQEIVTIQRIKENAIYNLDSNRDLSGSAGSEFKRDARSVKEQMYDLHSQIIEKERHCKSLDKRNALCGGCLDMAYENCREQLKTMKDDLDDLECELAKLHGMGDMMDDCE